MKELPVQSRFLEKNSKKNTFLAKIFNKFVTKFSCNIRIFNSECDEQVNVQ